MTCFLDGPTLSLIALGSSRGYSPDRAVAKEVWILDLLPVLVGVTLLGVARGIEGKHSNLSTFRHLRTRVRVGT